MGSCLMLGLGHTVDSLYRKQPYLQTSQQAWVQLLPCSPLLLGLCGWPSHLGCQPCWAWRPECRGLASSQSCHEARFLLICPQSLPDVWCQEQSPFLAPIMARDCISGPRLRHSKRLGMLFIPWLDGKTLVTTHMAVILDLS